MIHRRSIPILLGSATIVLALILPNLFMPEISARASRLQLPAATSLAYLPFIANQTTITLVTPTPTATATQTGSAISIMSIAFNPNSPTFKVGTTVVWMNNDPFSHTVTSGACPPCTASGMFNSNNLFPGQTFQFTFNSIGNFPYFCQIHTLSMTGTINIIP